MPSLRICKIWDSEYPWDVRVEKVATALTRAGHDVHLVARNRKHQPLREILPEAEVHRMKPVALFGRGFDGATSFPAFFNPRWVSAITDTAREIDANLILVRDLPLAPTAIWVGRRLKLPVMLDMAENYPAMMRSLWETGVHKPADWFARNPKFVEMVENWTLPRLDHTLVVIEESRDRIHDLGVPLDRVTVVGNTPSRTRLDAVTPREHVGGKPLELIYLGLLEAPRGIGNLIDAVARVRAAGTAVNLTVIGSGREAATFEQRARNAGLDASVARFLGRVPNADALKLLQTADVGVVPHLANESWNTTIPNKLFDYMAGGLAVLTSNAKPAARVVRETNAGLVYQHDDVDDLARAITQLDDAAKRAELGACGRKAIATTFNWEEDSARLLAAVERVAAAGPKAGR